MNFKLFLFSLFTAVILFLSIFESISYVKYQNGTKETPKLDTLREKVDITQYVNQDKLKNHRDYIECMEKEGIMSRDCRENKKSSALSLVDKTNSKESFHYHFFYDLEKSNIVIKVIYIFLILVFTQQFYLYLLVKHDYVLDIYAFHKAEWAINVAPMFGLLGTFFSMAILLNSSNENIDVVLIKNFFDAVMTTMIGIIFYIINFYLKITIYPNIKELKND